MTQASNDSQLGPRVLTMQIVIAALLVGGVAAGIIFVIIGPLGPGNAPAALPVVTYVGLGFAAILSVVSFVLPNVIIMGARRQIIKGTFGDLRVEIPPDDAGKLLMV